MSTTSPDRISQLLQFGGDHAPVFLANAANIGILPATATSYNTAYQAFADAVAAATKARQESKRATDAQNEALQAFRSLNGDVVRKIRSFAQLQADPNKTYGLAQIDPIAPPSPVGPPGVCTDFKVFLNSDGSIRLTWKCKNPPNAAGTGYAVRRRNGPTGSFMFVGTSGKKDFIDRTIPAGTSTVTYEVQGQRSGINGPVSQFTVQFGMGGNGQATVSVTNGQNDGNGPLHIAA